MGKVEQKYIEHLRRFILIHSYIYYNLNDNAVDDKYYDKMSRELVELQSKYKDENTMYHKVFEDFDGNTGFDLIGKLDAKDLEYIKVIALYVLKESRR